MRQKPCFDFSTDYQVEIKHCTFNSNVVCDCPKEYYNDDQTNSSMNCISCKTPTSINNPDYKRKCQICQRWDILQYENPEMFVMCFQLFGFFMWHCGAHPWIFGHSVFSQFKTFLNLTLLLSLYFTCLCWYIHIVPFI